MKLKLKVIFFCIFFICLFAGGLKIVSNVVNENKNSEAKESVSTNMTSDQGETKNGTSSNEAVENSEKDKEQNIQTEKPKEVKKKVIVLDPGHGNKSNLEKEPISPGSEELKIKDGGGAEGINSKTPEYAIAMGITIKLKELLINKGYTVIMTKTTSEERPGNIERAEVGNKNNADLVIRIHADSSESSSASGASMLVPAPIGYAKDISGISRKYGEVILKSLVDEVGMKNKGVVERKDLTGFNWSKVPVILIETGFLSNPQEDKLLNTDDYQNKIANGLFDGINSVITN